MTTKKTKEYITCVLHDVQKKLKAPKNQINKFGGYKYRSCEDIVEAVKEILPEGYVLLLKDEIVDIGDRIYVRATASFCGNEQTVHSSAFAREPLDKKGMDASQITGAASSYARKYALNGLFAIDDTKDADSGEVVHAEPKATYEEKIDPKSEYFDAKEACIHTNKRLSSFKDVGGLIAYWNQEKVKERVKKIFEVSSKGANGLVELFEKQKDALND